MENKSDVDGFISKMDENEHISSNEGTGIMPDINLKVTDDKQDRIKQRDIIYKDFSFPPLIRRIQAIFIDIGILILVFFIATYLTILIGEIPSWAKIAILIFMIYLYDPLLVSVFGGTIGHQMMNMKVKKYNNPNKNIWIGAAVLRYFIKGLLGWLSFITITFNKRKRSLHDMASGSIVIDKR